MTKHLLTALLLAAWLHPGLALAGELQVPEQFDVLMVNGKEFPATLSRTKTVALSTGRNVVIIEFDKIYDADYGDSHDRVHSAPFALVFNAAATDQLQLFGPELNSGADAKRYVKAPTVQLLTAGNQPVALQQLPVTELNGLLVADNRVENKAEQGAATTITAAPVMASDLAGPVASKTAAAPDALQMLSYWWQQASAEQRAEFLRQITH
ncbi:DUF2057 domain-containing protein [Permianibacter sp. IMCC34836]|uniref:DUF2057 domain-containing protein n=1 Tax=Permianibacter fluminis TaxID=2738515 RepID=UPI00155186EA|nr:DUF2057 domain-containing protein [Permianibacter fluminis]NQD38466.1 DUF2057 domain-containing protein [Permianibacter fluminis]